MIYYLIYQVVGIALILWLRGYENFPPPSRLVRQPEGHYKFKDYAEMPHWLWCIILTILWLPYMIIMFIDIRKHWHL